MEKYIIRGGRPLMGDIEVSGMKNAAVPVILSTVLLDDVCTLENLPNILDVSYSLEILQSMGAVIKRINKNTVQIDTRHVKGGSSPYDLVRKMRGSYYIMGAELGRFGYANVGCPGGCDFGVRPIDQHIKGFRALGAQVNVDGGYLEAKATSGLRAAHLFFDKVSVGATINVIIAATRAKGTTIIENAAREPHVVDLANFLNSCGARISGAGTDVIKIRGVDRLYGCTYAIIPDMIEAGTYMIAAAATKGRLHIRNVIPKHLESISAKLEEMGAQIQEFDDSVLVSGPASLSPTDVRTQPYPGLPTDVHPQICVLLCLAQGVSYLTEGVWDNRFRYVEELKRMGAQIKVDGKMAIIEGGQPLSAAPVQAVDLRAGAAVVIAALTANGRSEVENIFHIERGYDDMVAKLRGVGADIQRVAVPDEYPLETAN
ncbi:MAG: UDP-N-acetylglucosamine 1-carboxyvinyltransferase [Eubacteriales bacterium]|nr:UDP-N-acetylglucosamine 1-carboxyvinyltransferase [Eubacteriales bacterium]